MKFAAKVLSISPKFVIPPKQDFWFGDPCYVFHGPMDPFWSPFLMALRDASWDHKAAHVEVTVDDKVYPIWVAGTRSGDGSYPFSWKVGANIYAGCAGVDAGMLAILPKVFPGMDRSRDCLYVPFRTGPRTTVVEIRDGSWCRGRVPVCLT